MQTVRGEAQGPKRSAPSRNDIPIWLWVTLVALFGLAIYSARTAEKLRKDIQAVNERAAVILQQRHELEAQLKLAKREATILTDPASVKITLASQDPAIPQLEAKWHSQLGIVLTGQKIAAPSANRVLQLWLIPNAPGGKPVPSLTVRPDADGKFVLLVSNPSELIAATKALAITEEPEGGSPQPTTAPRWIGGIS